MKDIVEPLGITFANPLPLLLHHDHRLPVGTVTFGTPTAKGVEFEATIASIKEPGVLKDRTDEAWHSVSNGVIRATSIGFQPVEHEPIAGGGIRFKRSSVFEMSLVTVPANADCTIQLVKSLDNEFLRAASGNADKQDLLAGVSAKSLSPHQLSLIHI